MSTIVPPDHEVSTHTFVDERPWWCITYNSGDICCSDEHQWNEIATLERVGGIHVPMSKDLIKVLHIQYRGVNIAFAPPEPARLFAFARYAMSLTPAMHVTLSQWRYTLFGYECEMYRSLLICTPLGFEVRSQSPDEPLPL